MQLVEIELPGGEWEFAGQGVHADAPVDCWYLPAPHAVHVPPAGPCQPALQVQLLKAVLCSGELEFAGQPLQMLGPDTLL